MKTVQKKGRPDWEVWEETVLSEAPDGILLQGLWLPTPKRPLEVAVAVVWQEKPRVDPIYKKK
ncbi:hypothetical protein CDL15_Pgr000284 [Punica granatum]|nr:hypothetical protein CDL15_Pgr000284 [Punica granatum]